MRETPADKCGFALVVVLTLLSVLVLVTYAISLVGRVDTQVGTSAVYQTQARQNALLGMRIALADLQVQAGPNYRVTGMAGVVGIAPNASNNTRHWCGIWAGDGAFLRWMTSGATGSSSIPSIQSGLNVVELLSTGAMGAATSNSEHVVAGVLPIRNSAGGDALGNYAYLVTDEGVKISAYAPDPILGEAPAIFTTSTSPSNAQALLRDAISTYAAKLSECSAYESLAFLRGPNSTLSPSVLQDNRHHVALQSQFLVSDVLRTGMININTNSVHVWRGIIQTYNNLPAVSVTIPAATVSSRGTTVQNGIAGYVGPEKAENGPYQSVNAFRAYFRLVFPNSGSPTADQILDEIETMLTVRSDTFRIRAYGDAINPADTNDPNAKPEAVAYCEAIVQRTPEIIDSVSGPLGRRFVITYFRWLGPDDI